MKTIKIFNYNSPIGLLKIKIYKKKIIYLKPDDEVNNYIQPPSCALANIIIKQLDEYFSDSRKNFDIPLEFRGTDFQKIVWNELLKIPYGSTKSYQEIASNLGDKKLARAVGNANGKNQIIILVPCHRVIKSDKSLGGYTGGINIKKTLLEIEKNNI